MTPIRVACAHTEPGDDGAVSDAVFIDERIIELAPMAMRIAH